MQIDVFQDTACPWCRIGKKNLRDALAQWGGEDVTVRYRTFFLNDQIPPEGYPFRTYMTAKGGGRIPLQEFFDAPRRAGEAVGLTFNIDKIEVAPNTLLSHRLIALAPEEKKEALIDAIYAAYFEYARNIGDLEVLLDIAAQQGMDAAETRALLEGDAMEDEVVADYEWAKSMGISGVPLFIFDNRYALSGAQPIQAFLQVLDGIKNETIAK
jgi:predicted DsbA family dithiol-disulfide isomerase